MVLKEKLREIESRLQSVSGNDAESDARLFMQTATGLDYTGLILQQGQELDEIVVTKLDEMVAKRLTHIPVQYITGTANFMGYDIICHEEVLIPRYDTENLVSEALRAAKNAKQDHLKVLDMCTGTGCIGITYFLERKRKGMIDDVTLVDISDVAIETAKKNVSKLTGDDEHIRVIKSDLFSEIEGEFDIIISNPPYIRSADIEELLPEVKDHEPRLALDGTEDGLLFYRKITEGAEKHLSHGGMLLYEIGYDQAEDVRSIMLANGFSSIRVVRDLSGLNRVVFAKK